MKSKTTTAFFLMLMFIGLLNLQFLCLEESNEDPSCIIKELVNGQQIEKGEIVTVAVEATDSDGTITNVAFFIDNIQEHTSISAPFTYDWDTSEEEPGDHLIKASATDDDDATSYSEIAVTIIQTALPPEAQFEATPLSGTSPLEVTFNDLSLNDPQSWLWDFGDGFTSTGQHPVHTYTGSGTYTVALTVSNPQGSDTEIKNDYIGVTEGGGGTENPCPGLESITYEGQVYHTVLIGQQCWLKENLNVGTRLSANISMSDNGVIEKYCYGNIDANCITYGALYQWREVMQYTITEGVQGICPEGWHVPTDAEWITLEGTTDSQYDPEDETWNSNLWRGFDAGAKLKATAGWDGTGNGSDQYGFSALPAGYHRLLDNGLGSETYIWTSKSDFGGSTAYYRRLSSTQSNSYRWAENSNYGHSVRCIKDAK